MSEQGKEAVLALMGDHEFFGEGCLTGQPIRLMTALGWCPPPLWWEGLEASEGILDWVEVLGRLFSATQAVPRLFFRSSDRHCPGRMGQREANKTHEEEPNSTWIRISASKR